MCLLLRPDNDTCSIILNLFLSYLKDVVDVVFLAPLHESVDHEDGLVHFELPRPQEAQKIVVIILWVLSDVVVLDVLAELFKRLLLVFRHVAHEAMWVGLG